MFGFCQIKFGVELRMNLQLIGKILLKFDSNSKSAFRIRRYIFRISVDFEAIIVRQFAYLR